MSGSVRAISLVKHVEFEFSGTVLKNAICIGDADNDGHNELVVGCADGNLSIFKGRQLVQRISKLDFITCLAIGDIFNEKRNSLVVITGVGWCFIYDSIIEPAPKSQLNPETETKFDEADSKTETSLEQRELSVDTVIEKEAEDVENSNAKSPNDTPSDYCSTIKDKKPIARWVQVYSQRIPANSKEALLVDVDGDGSIELVLGLTDRVVRSYRWFASKLIPAPTSTSPTPTTPISSPDSGDNHRHNINAHHHHHRRPGRLSCLNKWECARQVGALAMQWMRDGRPALMVAQPGGTFMRIRSLCDEVVGGGQMGLEEEGEVERSGDSSNSTSENLTGSAIDYQFLAVAHMRNPNISTEIVGDLQTQLTNAESEEDGANDDNQLPYPYAVATLDGNIMLVRDEEILWAIAVDHQIFILNKLDMTGDGADEVIACTWDGHTYILDQRKNVVKFKLRKSVQTFASGRYTLDANNANVICFVYVTFEKKILLYYDIPLDEMCCKRYVISDKAVRKLIPDDDDAKAETDLKQQLTARDKRDLVQYLLYSVKTG